MCSTAVPAFGFQIEFQSFRHFPSLLSALLVISLRRPVHRLDPLLFFLPFSRIDLSLQVSHFALQFKMIYQSRRNPTPAPDSVPTCAD
jgi:hypothetical protein